MVVTLLSGVAYIVISEDTDVPLALSDADMEELRGTVTWNSECLRNRLACGGQENYTCTKENPYVFIPYNDYRQCYPNYTNFACHEHKFMQRHCYYEVWNPQCTRKRAWGFMEEPWCQTLTN